MTMRIWYLQVISLTMKDILDIRLVKLDKKQLNPQSKKQTKFTMKEIDKYLEILKEYNVWRRGDSETFNHTPKELGIAIDNIIEYVEKQKRRRKA